jgi:hypothetical protein
MSKYALMALTALAVLASPSSAVAIYECQPTTISAGLGGPPEIWVYALQSNYDDPAFDPNFTVSKAAAGACVDSGPSPFITSPALDFYGGSVEAGLDSDDGTLPDGSGGFKYDGPGAYVVVDGDDRNRNWGVPPPSGVGANATRGYYGVSNYESNERVDPGCNGVDEDDLTSSGDRGSNSGWCTWISATATGSPIPLVCDIGSGAGSFDDTWRDGCRIP